MSVYSMTGYASVQSLASATATATEPTKSATAQLGLEIRSVNSRFLDVSFRLPEDLRHWEPQLREILAARLTYVCESRTLSSSYTPKPRSPKLRGFVFGCS